MTLTVTVELEDNDLEEADLLNFVHEAAAATGLNLEVGRVIEEEDGSSIAVRMFKISAEYFNVRVTP